MRLILGGETIGIWEEGKWPGEQFLNVMNISVVKYEVPNDRLIILYFENGIEMHLSDDSDQYECIQISMAGEPGQWII